MRNVLTPECPAESNLSTFTSPLNPEHPAESKMSTFTPPLNFECPVRSKLFTFTSPLNPECPDKSKQIMSQSVATCTLNETCFPAHPPLANICTDDNMFDVQGTCHSSLYSDINERHNDLCLPLDDINNLCCHDNSTTGVFSGRRSLSADNIPVYAVFCKPGSRPTQVASQADFERCISISPPPVPPKRFDPHVEGFGVSYCPLDLPSTHDITEKKCMKKRRFPWFGQRLTNRRRSRSCEVLPNAKTTSVCLGFPLLQLDKSPTISRCRDISHSVTFSQRREKTGCSAEADLIQYSESPIRPGVSVLSSHSHSSSNFSIVTSPVCTTDDLHHATSRIQFSSNKPDTSLDYLAVPIVDRSHSDSRNPNQHSSCSDRQPTSNVSDAYFTYTHHYATPLCNSLVTALDTVRTSGSGVMCSVAVSISTALDSQANMWPAGKRIAPYCGTVCDGISVASWQSLPYDVVSGDMTSETVTHCSLHAASEQRSIVSESCSTGDAFCAVTFSGAFPAQPLQSEPILGNEITDKLSGLAYDGRLCSDDTVSLGELQSVFSSTPCCTKQSRQVSQTGRSCLLNKDASNIAMGPICVLSTPQNDIVSPESSSVLWPSPPTDLLLWIDNNMTELMEADTSSSDRIHDIAYFDNNAHGESCDVESQVGLLCQNGLQVSPDISSIHTDDTAALTLTGKYCSASSVGKLDTPVEFMPVSSELGYMPSMEEHFCLSISTSLASPGLHTTPARDCTFTASSRCDFSHHRRSSSMDTLLPSLNCESNGQCSVECSTHCLKELFSVPQTDVRKDVLQDFNSAGQTAAAFFNLLECSSSSTLKIVPSVSHSTAMAVTGITWPESIPLSHLKPDFSMETLRSQLAGSLTSLSGIKDGGDVFCGGSMSLSADQRQQEISTPKLHIQSVTGLSTHIETHSPTSSKPMDVQIACRSSTCSSKLPFHNRRRSLSVGDIANSLKTSGENETFSRKFTNIRSFWHNQIECSLYAQPPVVPCNVKRGPSVMKLLQEQLFGDKNPKSTYCVQACNTVPCVEHLSCSSPNFDRCSSSEHYDKYVAPSYSCVLISASQNSAVTISEKTPKLSSEFNDHGLNKDAQSLSRNCQHFGDSNLWMTEISSSPKNIQWYKHEAVKSLSVAANRFCPNYQPTVFNRGSRCESITKLSDIFRGLSQHNGDGNTSATHLSMDSVLDSEKWDQEEHNVSHIVNVGKSVTPCNVSIVLTNSYCPKGRRQHLDELAPTTMCCKDGSAVELNDWSVSQSVSHDSHSKLQLVVERKMATVPSFAWKLSSSDCNVSTARCTDSDCCETCVSATYTDSSVGGGGLEYNRSMDGLYHGRKNVKQKHADGVLSNVFVNMSNAQTTKCVTNVIEDVECFTGMNEVKDCFTEVDGAKRCLIRGKKSLNSGHRMQKRLSSEGRGKKDLTSGYGVRKCATSEGRVKKDLTRGCGVKKSATSEGRVKNDFTRGYGVGKIVTSEDRVKNDLTRECGVKKSLTCVDRVRKGCRPFKRLSTREAENVAVSVFKCVSSDDEMKGSKLAAKRVHISGIKQSLGGGIHSENSFVKSVCSEFFSGRNILEADTNALYISCNKSSAPQAMNYVGTHRALHFNNIDSQNNATESLMEKSPASSTVDMTQGGCNCCVVDTCQRVKSRIGISHLQAELSDSGGDVGCQTQACISPVVYPISPVVHPISPVVYPISPVVYPISPVVHPMRTSSRCFSSAVKLSEQQPSVGRVKSFGNHCCRNGLTGISTRRIEASGHSRTAFGMKMAAGRGTTLVEQCRLSSRESLISSPINGGVKMAGGRNGAGGSDSGRMTVVVTVDNKPTRPRQSPTFLRINRRLGLADSSK